jgi:hypothetical protein
MHHLQRKESWNMGASSVEIPIEILTSGIGDKYNCLQSTTNPNNTMISQKYKGNFLFIPAY